MRSLGLERLVQGLRHASVTGELVPAVMPAPPSESEGVEVGLGTLVLEPQPGPLDAH